MGVKCEKEGAERTALWCFSVWLPIWSVASPISICSFWYWSPRLSVRFMGKKHFIGMGVPQWRWWWKIIISCNITIQNLHLLFAVFCSLICFFKCQQTREEWGSGESLSCEPQNHPQLKFCFSFCCSRWSLIHKWFLSSRPTVISQTPSPYSDCPVSLGTAGLLCSVFVHMLKQRTGSFS